MNEIKGNPAHPAAPVIAPLPPAVNNAAPAPRSGLELVLDYILHVLTALGDCLGAIVCCWPNKDVVQLQLNDANERVRTVNQRAAPLRIEIQQLKNQAALARQANQEQAEQPPAPQPPQEQVAAQLLPDGSLPPGWQMLSTQEKTEHAVGVIRRQVAVIKTLTTDNFTLSERLQASLQKQEGLYETLRSAQSQIDKLKEQGEQINNGPEYLRQIDELTKANEAMLRDPNLGQGLRVEELEKEVASLRPKINVEVHPDEVDALTLLDRAPPSSVVTPLLARLESANQQNAEKDARLSMYGQQQQTLLNESNGLREQLQAASEELNQRKEMHAKLNDTQINLMRQQLAQIRTGEQQIQTLSEQNAMLQQDNARLLQEMQSVYTAQEIQQEQRNGGERLPQHRSSSSSQQQQQPDPLNHALNQLLQGLTQQGREEKGEWKHNRRDDNN